MISRTQKIAALMAGVGASLFALHVQVAAQEAPASGQAEAPKPGVADIVVTAQRRDGGLSKTPVTVQVLSADTLGKAQIATEQDLRSATPGLAVRTTINSNQLNYAVRGQSVDTFSGSAPGVLPYINEVQIGGTGGSTAFYDLQSVQVLKGPQGTLFGRSATGGAVLFTTARPTDELSGYGSVTFGNYDAVKIEGAVGGPLVGDKVTARIAGFRQVQDGFQRNIYGGVAGSRRGDIDRYGVRGSLSVDLGRFRNDLVVDHFHSSGGNTVAVISGIMPVGTPGFTGVPTNLLYGGTADPVARVTGQCVLQGFIGGPACNFNPANGAIVTPSAQVAGFYDAYFAQAHHPAGGLSSVFADQQRNGPYVVNSDQADFYRANNIIVTNTTAFDVGDNLTVKNIFGYVDIKTYTSIESDGAPYGIFQNSFAGDDSRGFRDRTKQISEEIQLQGKLFNDRLDYTTGVYYSHDNIASPHNALFFDLVFGGIPQNNQYKKINTTYAGYAQGTFKLNDSGLSVTGGVRYTSEKARQINLPGDSIVVALGNPAPPGFDYDQSQKYNKVSWQFGIQDQINPDLLLYAVTRRAYKSGGYNGSLSPKVGDAAAGGNAFGAEQVTDVEAGIKFFGSIGSMRTRLNVAGYYIWTKDSQRTAYALVGSALSTLTVNVPKGRTYGFEIDGQIQPLSWLTLGGNYNYTNAAYTDGNVTVVGQSQLFDQVPDAPKHTGIVYADVTVPITSGLNGVLHGDLYGQTRTFTSPQSLNSFGTTIPGYVLANFRAGVEIPDSGLTFTASLKNAFNKIYYGGGVPLAPLAQINLLVPGAPRTFTFEARIKF